MKFQPRSVAKKQIRVFHFSISRQGVIFQEGANGSCSETENENSSTSVRTCRTFPRNIAALPHKLFFSPFSSVCILFPPLQPGISLCLLSRMSEQWARRFDVTHARKPMSTVTAGRVTQSLKSRVGPMSKRIGGRIALIDPNRSRKKKPTNISAGRLTAGERIRCLHEQVLRRPSDEEKLKTKAENEVLKRKCKSGFAEFMDQVGVLSRPKQRRTSDALLHKSREKRRRCESQSHSQTVEDIIDEGSAFMSTRPERQGIKASTASGYNALTQSPNFPGLSRSKRKPLKFKYTSSAAKKLRTDSEETSAIVPSENSSSPELCIASKKPRRKEKSHLLVSLSVHNEIFAGTRSSPRCTSPSANSNDCYRLTPAGQAISYQPNHLATEGISTTGTDIADNRIDLTTSTDDESNQEVRKMGLGIASSQQNVSSLELLSARPCIEEKKPSVTTFVPYGKVGSAEHGRTSPISAQNLLAFPPVDSESDSPDEKALHIPRICRKRKSVTVPTERWTRSCRTRAYTKAEEKVPRKAEASKDGIVEEILDGDNTREAPLNPLSTRVTTQQSPIVVDDSPSPKRKSARRKPTSQSRSKRSSTTPIPADKFYRAKLRQSTRRTRHSSLVCESGEDLNGNVEEEIRFRRPSEKERAQLIALTSSRKKEKVVTTIKEANIELKAEDFRRLGGSCWLSDELINSFVALVNERNYTYCACNSANTLPSGSQVLHFNKTSDEFLTHSSKNPSGACSSSGPANTNKEGLQPQEASSQDIIEIAVNKSQDFTKLELFEMPRPRSHIFNTFFYPRLVQGEYDFNGVKRWLKRAGRNIAELDLIMVPINIDNIHWVLAAIDLRGRRFFYFDSTYGPDCLDSLRTLRRWLKDEVEDKCGKKKADEMDVESWPSVVNPSYVPKQLDDGSCGIFAIYMAEFLERGIKPSFTQQNICALRQRTALFLANCRLPES